MEINELIKTGRLKVVRTLKDWFGEFRQYHVRMDKNGKSHIVKKKDDLMDGTRYAYMMRRYAIRICDLYPEEAYRRQAAQDDGRDYGMGY